jgi:hypothetical protein
VPRLPPLLCPRLNNNTNTTTNNNTNNKNNTGGENGSRRQIGMRFVHGLETDVFRVGPLPSHLASDVSTKPWETEPLSKAETSVQEAAQRQVRLRIPSAWRNRVVEGPSDMEMRDIIVMSETQSLTAVPVVDRRLAVGSLAPLIEGAISCPVSEPAGKRLRTTSQPVLSVVPWRLCCCLSDGGCACYS